MPIEMTYRQCPTCLQEFTVAKKRTRQPGRGIYCRLSCRPGMPGKSNPAYKHGDSRHASRYTRPYKRAHPEVAAAHAAVATALAKGILTKPDACEQCRQVKRLDGHHEDYSQPLAVRWLCRKCHNAHHAEPQPA